jgi:hypothetical protein
MVTTLLVVAGAGIAAGNTFGLGSAYLIWLSVGLLRGKVRSGLAGDMAEMGGQK